MGSNRGTKDMYTKLKKLEQSESQTMWAAWPMQTTSFENFHQFPWALLKNDNLQEKCPSSGSCCRNHPAEWGLSISVPPKKKRISPNRQLPWVPWADCQIQSFSCSHIKKNLRWCWMQQEVLPPLEYRRRACTDTYDWSIVECQGGDCKLLLNLEGGDRERPP